MIEFTYTMSLNSEGLVMSIKTDLLTFKITDSTFTHSFKHSVLVPLGLYLGHFLADALVLHSGGRRREASQEVRQEEGGRKKF